jgi:hypothetical protein
VVASHSAVQGMEQEGAAPHPTASEEGEGGGRGSDGIPTVEVRLSDRARHVGVSSRVSACCSPYHK